MKWKSCGVLLLMLLTPVLSACSKGRSSPPGPDSSFGVVRDGVHCTYLKWNEGLAVMLIDRMNNHSGHGSSSTKDARHRHLGSSLGKDGSRYDWELITKDGKTAAMSIDGQSYDLTNGAVFAVDVVEGKVIVHQIDKDLSSIGNSIDECSEFIRQNPDIVERLAPKSDDSAPSVN